MRVGFVLFICILLASGSYAQTFRAALIGGINLSQIDGDNMAGYDKLGWNVGAKAHAFIAEKWSVAFEILYSEKGARASLIDRQFVPPTDIRLRYAEVPVMINYHDPNGMIFAAGFSYNQLFRFVRVVNGVNTSNQAPIPDDDDWMIVGGITYVIKEKVGINARMSYSLVRIATDPRSNLKKDQWLNNVVSLRLLYYN